MVVFVLNDNLDFSVVEGGCYWSFVVYSRLVLYYSFYISFIFNFVFDLILVFVYFICYRLDWVGGYGSFVGSMLRF